MYLGLVHHPINNKRGEVVTTSVTNLDIHDISRSCRTFGIKEYFLITPLKAQQELLGRILGHWNEDKSSVYNPDRSDALKIARGVSSIEEAKSQILEREKKEGLEAKDVCVVVTGANFKSYDGLTHQLKEKMKIDKRPILLLFGTGWGLTAPVVEGADFRLEPIFGASQDGYNHLSVRSAVAIYLDRILGASGLK
jgi:hypothetical protein